MPHFGLASHFFVRAPHSTSAYGARVGRAVLLTMRVRHYMVAELDLSAITCYKMLLATYKFKILHYCISVDPRTVGSGAISDSGSTSK